MDEKTEKAWQKLMDAAFKRNFIKWFNRGFEEVVSPRIDDLEDGLDGVKTELKSLKHQFDRLDRKSDFLHNKVNEDSQKIANLEQAISG